MAKKKTNADVIMERIAAVDKMQEEITIAKQRIIHAQHTDDLGDIADILRQAINNLENAIREIEVK